MHMGPNSSALRTPFQGATGLGARQRSSPTGGAAKGRPLKTVMSGFVPCDAQDHSAVGAYRIVDRGVEREGYGEDCYQSFIWDLMLAVL